MSLVLIKDTLTPDLRKRAKAAADKKPLLRAMGTAALGLGKQAFTDTAARPSAWAPRKDQKKTHPLLLESGTMETSLRMQVEASQVILRSDRPYAATHQLGSDKLNIPARPYLPFYKSGQITPMGAKKVQSALRAALRVQGL